MKRPAHVYILEILLFLVLLASAFFFLAPVSKKLDSSIKDVQIKLLGQLEAQTGLSISYTSLSPSIFRSLTFQDLVIKDGESNIVIIKIHEVSVTYSLFEILRGNISGSLREIVIKNGSVSVDALANQSVIARLKKLIDSVSAQSVNNREVFSFSNVQPVIIKVRNIDVSYTDSNQRISGKIVTGTADIGDEGISFKLDSRFQYSKPSLFFVAKANAEIGIEGTINRSFNSGSASIMLQSIKTKDIAVRRLGLVISFKNGIITFSSVQNLQPVNLQGTYNLGTKEFSSSIECEKLFPFKWITLSAARDSMLAKMQNSILSGSLSMTINEKRGLEYSAAIDMEIPESVYGGGMLALACNGTAERINVEKCTATGTNIDASYSGIIDIKRMIPEGFLSLKKINVPDKGYFSGDVYMQGEKNGFVCLIPELKVNSGTFTSVELVVQPKKDSIEFTLSAYDTSGHMSAEGTCSTGKEKFLQMYAAFDSISIVNSIQSLYGFLPVKNREIPADITGNLSEYALTTEVYISTDFTDFSFNCTRLILASNQKNGLYLLLSANGTKESIDITDIMFSRGDYAVSGKLHLNLETTGDILFDINLVINSIPYNATGIYGKNTISIYGDYNLSVSIFLDPLGGVSGTFRTESLPVPIGTALVSLSLNADFNIAEDFAWKVVIRDGSVEEMRHLLPLSTVISFSGDADNSGVFFKKLSLSDRVSQLSGNARFNVLPKNSGQNATQFNSDIELKSDVTGESISATGTMTLAEEVYFNAQISLVKLPLMRFIQGQQPSNLISLSTTFSGTPTNILASVNVQDLIFRLFDYDVNAHGNFTVEDKSITLRNGAASWTGHNFSDIKGIFSLETLLAHLDVGYSTVIGRSGLTASLGMDLVPDKKVTEISSFQEIPRLLDRFTVNTAITDVKWNSLQSTEPFLVRLTREPGVLAFYAGKNDAVNGFLLDDGTFSMQSGANLPISFQADGTILNPQVSVNVSKFSTNLVTLWPYLGINQVAFQNGKLDGSFLISGNINDPDFTGELYASNITLTAPGLLGEPLGPASFDINAEGKNLSIPEFSIAGKSGAVYSKAEMVFDRWVPESISVQTRTGNGQVIKIAPDNQYIKSSAYASFNLNLDLTLNGIDLTGSVGLERGYVAVLSSGISQISKTSMSQAMDIKTNLELQIGQKLEFQYRWPTDDISIIRGLVQADKPLTISIDSVKNTFAIKGDANLKGGEIFYLKRSFYLRKGNIVFNENQDIFDPLITVQAEIRESDINGDPVRIILSVNNQHLSTFTPILTSDPPKTDLELMVLLGQATSADTSRETFLKDAVVTTSDLLAQMSLFRNAENTVRDLFGLDLFSIRTLILQNALLEPAMRKPGDPAMTIGNYFDNTTVYMGKYLGAALYVDGLLHFSYYDALSAQNAGNKQVVYQNLLFQPEIGLEVTTPLFMLRWALTPAHPDTLFVADNSITLSWKFSY